MRRRLLGLALSVALYAALVVAISRSSASRRRPSSSSTSRMASTSWNLAILRTSAARRRGPDPVSAPRAQASRGKPTTDHRAGRLPRRPPSAALNGRPAGGDASTQSARATRPLRSGSRATIAPATNVKPHAPPPDVVEPTPGGPGVGRRRQGGTPAAPTQQATGRSSGDRRRGPRSLGGAGAREQRSASAMPAEAGAEGRVAGSGTRDGSPLALALPGGEGRDPRVTTLATDTLRRRLHESLAYPASRGAAASAGRCWWTSRSMPPAHLRARDPGQVVVARPARRRGARGRARRVPRALPPGVPPRRLLVRLPVVFEIPLTPFSAAFAVGCAA